MEIKNLNTFIQVAELNSFTKAADRLGYSQSTISFQIKQLENELGVPLFERINHTVALTGKGREILQYAYRISKLAQEMESEGQKEEEVSGHIKLLMAESVCDLLLRNHFQEFRSLYPGITLKISTADTENAMFRLLNQNEADLVCTLDHRIFNTDYVIVREEKVGMHFVAGKGNPLEKKKNISLEELAEQPFILTERGMSYRRIMEERLAAASLEIKPVLEVGDTDLICQLVEQGIGISLLPDYATDKYIESGRMVYLDVTDFQIDMWKQLIHHRDKWISPELQAVISYLSEYLF